jgi:hypothetical protein
MIGPAAARTGHVALQAALLLSTSAFCMAAACKTDMLRLTAALLLSTNAICLTLCALLSGASANPTQDLL